MWMSWCFQESVLTTIGIRSKWIHSWPLPSLLISPLLLSGLTPSPSSSQTQSVMRTVPYVSTTATPRPALTPSSGRSQTPTCCPAVPLEKSTPSGLHNSSRPGLHLRPDQKVLSQSSVDSSGYSSSEGTYRKPTPASSSTSRMSTNSAAPCNVYKDKISSAFFRLMGEYCSV